MNFFCKLDILEYIKITLLISLLGETVIFVIAASILGFEYSRQKSNEKRKEETEANFLLQMERKIDDLAFSSEKLDTELREVKRLIYAHYGTVCIFPI